MPAIVTFNVISSFFTDAQNRDRFIEHNEYTESSVRYPIVAKQLAEMINDDPSTIFCFQEWGCSQVSYFGSFFVKHGYLLFSTLGGRVDRDYNSTAIAIPLKYYDAKVNKIALGREIVKPFGEMKYDPKPNVPGRRLCDNVYVEACAYEATLAVAELREKSTGKEFNVFSFHMPCAYYWPSIFTIYTETLLKKCSLISGDRPFFIGMDGNYMTGQFAYRMITGGNLEETYDVRDGKELSTLPHSEWKCPNGLPKMHDISSNEATNICMNPNNRFFSERLDYIYSSVPVKAKSEVLYKCSDKDIAPNERNGSDHYPVRVIFEW